MQKIVFYISIFTVIGFFNSCTDSKKSEKEGDAMGQIQYDSSKYKGEFAYKDIEDQVIKPSELPLKNIDKPTYHNLLDSFPDHWVQYEQEKSPELLIHFKEMEYPVMEYKQNKEVESFFILNLSKNGQTYQFTLLPFNLKEGGMSSNFNFLTVDYSPEKTTFKWHNGATIELKPINDAKREEKLVQ